MKKSEHLRWYISLALLSSGFTFVVYSQKNEKHIFPRADWHRNAIIYNIEVATFKDSDGNGIGDFNGLTLKLGYLDSLGINTLWLAPFHPSPRRDDGYDVSNYFAIDSTLGKVEDFRNFIKLAKAKNMKVIMDVVINHTSIEHPWYQEARRDSSSPFHYWYVWSKERPKDWQEGMVFPGVQTQTWTYDEVADKYYFHRFYEFQPDLNYENQQVEEMAVEILRYWLEEGIDGFRLDAVPFILGIPRSGSADPDHMFALLSRLRASIAKINPETIVLGEANVSAAENINYFGKDGERLDMMFNFYANQYLFYALASEKYKPFSKALERFRKKPEASQWAFFLRNHDEIDLGRLKKSERRKVYHRYGPKPEMQLYDRGLRRRLAPMLQDTSLIKMVYSLLFSLPGTPVLRYGEEIGMGDDLTLPERLSVRTPMQWDTTAFGGFTVGQKPFRRVIEAGPYGYCTVNVETQKYTNGSLLNTIKDLISLRKQFPEIGSNSYKIIPTGCPQVLAVTYALEKGELLILHNFSPHSQNIKLGRAYNGAQFNNQRKKTTKEISFTNDIEGYGYRWYTIQR